MSARLSQLQNTQRRSPNQKLTEEQVREICRMRRDEKKSLKEIAKDFGVSLATISRIAKGSTWSDVTALKEGETGKRLGEYYSQKGEGNPRAKLTEKTVLEIHDLVRRGLPVQEIAERFDVGETTVYAIAKGSTWTHLNLERLELPKHRPGAKLSPLDVEIARHFRSQGYSLRGIAKAFGVVEDTISAATTGRTWKDVGGVLKKPRNCQKLSPEQVQNIHALRQGGHSVSELCSLLGVSDTTARRILATSDRPRDSSSACQS